MKYFITILALALFLSCEDKCDCRKDVYEIKLADNEVPGGDPKPRKGVFIYSKKVECQEERRRVKMGNLKYYNIVCE